jgi:hypothetical protein
MPINVDPARIAKWLNDQWKGSKQCPLCHSNDWQISPRLAKLDQCDDPKNPGPTHIFLLAIATCGVCAYTLLLSAMRLGLVPSDETSAPAEATRKPPAAADTEGSK